MESNRLNLLINTGAALVGIILVGYFVYSSMHSDSTLPCSGRFGAATRFSLHTGDGKPLTAIELQARAGARDFGVIDNASVVAVTDGPAAEVMEVKLRKLPAGADPSDTARNGIEFRWSPPGVKGSASACVSYSVWFPKKFQFSGGGTLPGVFASHAAQPSDVKITVSAQWDGAGKPLIGTTAESGEIRHMFGQTTALPTGRWIRVDQEVTLNEPGQSNGTARLWIDGALVVEDKRISLRNSADIALAGVLVAAAHRRLPDDPGMLRLSPVDIAWR